jgi:hypothetical protein
MEGKELVVVPQGSAVATLDSMAVPYEAILRRKHMLLDIYEHIMKENTHYGKIPGCGDKPTLLKPGAEALSSTFQISPEYSITKTDLPGGHREYEIVCKLYSINGSFVGSGVGSATTMEGKYRFRVGGGDATDIEVPKKYWDTRKTDPKAAAKILRDLANQNDIEGDSFGTQKVDGVWRITTKSADAKIEHDNPADYYNTVLKMAKKRAFVDAILTTTGASDIFTQDIEDMPEVIPGADQGQGAPKAPGGSAMEQMDNIPDHGAGQGKPAASGAQPKPSSEAQHRKIAAVCKSKGITQDNLCFALSEEKTFGRQIMKVQDLTVPEASTLIGWLDAGQLDHLAAKDAA